ncbi:MAG: hypothetical protein ACKOAQ_00550, partial [Acidimicrobiaceae bacterium]
MSGVRVPGVLELVVVLELLELLEASGPNGDVVVVVELVPEIDEVVPGKVVVVPPIVVDVVELLEDVDDGRNVVVVELLLVDVGRTVVVVPRIVVDVDDAGRTVVSLVLLGQPPLGAGIRSPLWPPWPLRLLASTVIS